MSDTELDASPSASPSEPRVATPVGGKRRGRVRKRHTVGKVLLATVVVLALATGLGVVFLYRHLNGNLQVLDPTTQLSDRPEVTGPRGAMNILVMGDDTRQGKGNKIDGEAGAGGSDTTLLLHLSADRQHAYGISIPRDLLVDRPECKTKSGSAISAQTGAMWNAAYAVGGAPCTIQQFEQLTNIRLDHFIVVDFNGFKGMVDAVGGVSMCIPDDIDDPAHHIHIAAGTRKLKGNEALSYVRERYTIGNGSDVGRVKRQQAFIASMAHSVVTAGTLARPDRLVRFLDSATKSLTVDPGLKNVIKLAELGGQFKDIGLDNIRFITIPITPAPSDPNRLVLQQPQANQIWAKLRNDKPLTKRLSSDVISAGNLPGGSPSGEPSSSPSSSPSGTPSSSASGGPSSSPSGTPDDEASRQALQDAGLCV